MIEWEPGRDSSGRVSIGGGKPIYSRSKCGRYTISRAYTPRGWLSDAWLVVPRGVAIQLAGGVRSMVAMKAVEDHANGISVAVAG